MKRPGATTFTNVTLNAAGCYVDPSPVAGTYTFRATDWTSPQAGLLSSLPLQGCDNFGATYPDIYHACGNGGAARADRRATTARGAA